MKKYIMLFFSVLSALFILTACGALATEEPVTGSSPSGEQVAAASWESMGNQMQMASFLIGDIHYYQVYDWDEESEEKELERISIFRDDHSGSGAECVTSVDHGDILWYQADEGGDLYLFYQVGEGERQFFLQRWTASGTLVYEQEIWQEDSGNREGALSAVAHGAVSTAGERGTFFLFPGWSSCGYGLCGLEQGDIPGEPVRPCQCRRAGDLCVPDRGNR